MQTGVERGRNNTPCQWLHTSLDRKSLSEGGKKLSGEMYCPAPPLGGGLWGLEEAGQSSGASTRFK
jgi:hypothetical protein